MQEGKVVSYASHSLSKVETKYSKMGREVLAVVWAAERFHLYVYGLKFNIITYDKAFLRIFIAKSPYRPTLIDGS